MRPALFPGVLIVLGALGACRPAEHDPPPTPSADAAPTGQHESEDSLTLSPQQIAHLGITLEPAAAAAYTQEAAGFAVVLARDVIAQALTDIVAAQAAARQSHAALERMRLLAGTAGADSASTRDSAERQSTSDDAALELAQAKAAALGPPSRWQGDAGRALTRGLAAGRIKLLRVTFPLGAVTADTPRHVRVQRLGRDRDSTGAVTALWAAPADSSMPGRSYFALLEKSDAADGERLLAWASGSEAAQQGVVIPASALVISGDEYWCYLERTPGIFVRASADVSRPLQAGYFIAQGIHPGDRVVTSGAGLLLAHETGGAKDAEP